MAGLDNDWLQTVRNAVQWMYRQVEGFTVLPEPCTDQALQEWHDFMISDPKKFSSTLKRAQYHAILQRAVHSDVHTFHCNILDLLQKGGLVSTTSSSNTVDIAEETREHRCIVCHASWPTYRAWAVHSFKAHGRLSAYRQLQTGNRCESCGRTFANYTKLTRHFRAAAQRRWEPPQPAGGSRVVTEAMAYDAMIPYIDTPGPIVSQRAGWAMTEPTFKALKLLTAVDWSQPDHALLQEICTSLQALPLHHSEFEQVLEAQLAYYAGQPDATGHLQDFGNGFRPLFGQPTASTTSSSSSTSIKPDALRDLSTLRFDQVPIPQRGSPRFHYILHLFAGAKREGDLHSCLMEIMEQPREDGVLLFPISLDVILDPKQGDLLSADIQQFWLSRTLAGLVLATVAGPPCETWSVSRMRALDGDCGPRPLRSTVDVHTLLWSIMPLKIREILQTTVGNLLLQFSLLMMTAHAITATLGLLEHPSPPMRRGQILPPSMWNSPT